MCFKISLKFPFLIWLSFQRVFCDDEILLSKESNHAEGRFVPPPPPLFPSILYPINAATGILVAIAIPVTDLPYQNVFVSYNFEANYNMPNSPKEDFPGLLQLNGPTRVQFTYDQINNPVLVTTPETDVPLARNMEGESDVTTPSPKNSSNRTVKVKNISNATGKSSVITNATLAGNLESDGNKTATLEKARKLEEQNLNDRILFTRRGFYNLVESRLDASGINGKKCLLLAICESSKFPLIDSNGVLGHVLHIILTPSTSIKEDLPREFDKAEKSGLAGNCAKYEKQCNVNVLNVFSKIL